MEKILLVIDTDDIKIHFNEKVIGAFRTEKSAEDLLNYIYNLYDQTRKKLVKNRFKVKEATDREFFISKKMVANEKEKLNNSVPINPKKIYLPYLDPVDMTDFYKN